MLTAFITAQLVFDVAVLVLCVVTLLRRAPRADRPPDWASEFLALAEELVATVESSPAPARASTAAVARATEVAAPATSGEGRRSRPSAAPARPDRGAALALLRSGVAPEEVARRTGLTPAELRLVTSVAAAAAEFAPASTP